MEIECADCGCVVDRGVVLDRCDDARCCCRHLPEQAGPAGAGDGSQVR